MKAEQRYTAEELRRHLREVHKCTPKAVEAIVGKGYVKTHKKSGL
jgi:hypothetical protein